MNCNPITSHPLKWADLVDQVDKMSGDNPDVWIEDLREYGPCTIDGVPEKAVLVCEDEGTLALKASFSVIHDKKNNRITIRHHY